MAVSDRPWGDFSASDYTPAEWARACLIDTGQGAEDSKSRYKLPVREPGGMVNRNAIHAAAGRLNQTDAPPEAKAAAARKLASMYRDMGEDAPPHLMMMAGRAADTPNHAPIEHRDGGVKVNGVDFAQRLVTLIAVPYEQPAMVEYRSELWNEVFCRGAFNGIEKRPNRVRANRDHNKSRTVGKVAHFWPDRAEGLVAEVRIGQTPLGDETLALADEDMLSASVGFGVKPSDQILDRRSMTRRIKTAYLDHLSFVESPAYEGAQVLSVRDDMGGSAPAAGPLLTPELDQFIADQTLRWASERLNRQ